MTGQQAQELARGLDDALSSVPGATGVNNHMGSKATADEAFMAAVLAELGRRGLYFLDSRTTAATVASDVAAKLGELLLQRGTFLDAVEGEAAIERALFAAAHAAARDGTNVAIGHVQTPGLAAILARSLPSLRAAGVAPATPTELLGTMRGAAQ